MNDPHGDAGAATFTAGHDGACDDVQLLRRIGQGDEDAMAAFYREHGRVVLAQVLLVVGERVLAEEICKTRCSPSGAARAPSAANHPRGPG